MGKGAENTESDLSFSRSLYYTVTVNLTINTTVVGATRPAQPPWILGEPRQSLPTQAPTLPGSVHYLQHLHPLFLFFDPPQGSACARK